MRALFQFIGMHHALYRALFRNTGLFSRLFSQYFGLFLRNICRILDVLFRLFYHSLPLFATNVGVFAQDPVIFALSVTKSKLYLILTHLRHFLGLFLFVSVPNIQASSQDTPICLLSLTICLLSLTICLLSLTICLLSLTICLLSLTFSRW